MEPSTDQKKAIEAEKRDGTPFARTKVEAKEEAATLAHTHDLRLTPVHQTTWNGANGDQYDLRLASSPDGYRVVVHRWYSTGEVVVRAVFGSWWRPRPGREGVEFYRTVVRPDARTISEAVGEAREALVAAKEAR